MRDIKSHKRVNDIFFGPVERPLLRWLSKQMPGWVGPDLLTGIGVFGSVVILTSYWLTIYNRNFLWLASLGFIINWFGDSMDGTLARYRNIQRPKYGFFVDHTMDALSTVMIFTGLGLSPYVDFKIACLALIGYLLMSILVYVRTCVNGEFKISYAKLGPTEMRIIAISANTLVYFIGNPQLHLGFLHISVYDFLASIIAFLLMVFFLVSSLSQARSLAHIDQAGKIQEELAIRKPGD